MWALGLSSMIADIAILAVILLMVLRVVRKAGYRRGREWGLVGISLVLGILGYLLNDLATYWLGFVGRAYNLSFGELATLTVVNFAFSPFMLCVLPLLYYSFRKWPIETRASDADVFG
jgi:hypothetical protein